MENEDLHLDFPYKGVLSMPLNYNTIDLHFSSSNKITSWKCVIYWVIVRT